MNLYDYTSSLLLKVFVNNYINVCYLTDNLKDSRIINKVILDLYGLLPNDKKIPILKSNLREIVFNNGSKILILNNPITLKGRTITSLGYYGEENNIPNLVYNYVDTSCVVKITSLK